MVRQVDLLTSTWSKIESSILEVAKETFPSLDVNTMRYGSIEQGIGIDISDLDITITGVSCGGIHEVHVLEEQKLYYAIKEKLADELDLGNSFHIDTSAIPVIKLKFKETRDGETHIPEILVDLTISDTELPEK